MDNIIININSRFVDLNKYSASNFVYHLEEELKNVIYIKIGSIEVPTSFYNFLESKKNISFKISDGVNEDTITLIEGNYTSDSLLLYVQDILDVINTNRNQDYKIELNINNGKIKFTNINNFSIDFNNNSELDSLGIHLGFTKENYSGKSIEADNVIRLNTPLYFFLKINDFDNIQDHYVKNAFAKIIQTTGSYDLTVEGKSEYVSKDLVFRSPINLNRLEIKLVDWYDRILDLNGYNLSLTLEIGYVYDKQLYQQLNNNGIPNGDHRLKFFY